MMNWSYDALGWMWMVPTMIVVWGVAIAAAVFMIGGVYTRGFKSDPTMEKLRRRLLEGEITRDEYEHVLNLLAR